MENEDISTDLRKNDINLQEEFSKDSKVQLSESDRLTFAKEVLYGIAGLVIFGSISYAIFPDNKALVQIFELIKIGALPIVTLLISFYFPNNKR